MTYWAAFAANKWYKNKNNKMFDVRWNIKLKWFFLITACLHLSLCNLTTATWRQKLPHHWVNSESYILIWIAEPGAWAWVQPTTVYSTTATLQTVLERPGPGRHRAVAPGDRWSPVTDVCHRHLGWIVKAKWVLNEDLNCHALTWGHKADLWWLVIRSLVIVSSIIFVQIM